MRRSFLTILRTSTFKESSVLRNWTFCSRFSYSKRKWGYVKRRAPTTTSQPVVRRVLSHGRCKGVTWAAKLSAEQTQFITRNPVTLVQTAFVTVSTSTANKPTLYKLFIRSVLTYAAPVWSNTSPSNYRRLQILQSKCLRIIGNYPTRTPTIRLHDALNITLICDFIYHLTDKFFCCCPAHPNPLVRDIGNYTLADLLN
jgi:hypothetical protein